MDTRPQVESESGRRPEAAHILLIEDSGADAAFVSHGLRRLKDAAYVVSVAPTLRSGIAESLAKHPDCVLLDLQLPDSRGLETLTRLTARVPDVPVIVLTGMKDEEQGLAAVKAGAQDYLVKGRIEIDALSRSVRFALERARGHRAMRESEARFRLMFETSPIGLAICELDGKIVQVNEALFTLAGFSFADLLGRNFWDLTHREFEADDTTMRRSVLLERRSGPYERWLERPGGTRVPVLINGVVSTARDDMQLWFTVEDLTERRRAQEHLVELAMYDNLTGLANRTFFDESLGKALARAERSGDMLALLMIDLDRFKAVNDTLGHEAGDAVLKDVARRLKREVRAGDTVARLGGDEFAVILEKAASPNAIATVAQKILKALIPPLRIGQADAFVGGSIGIATYPGNGRTATDVTRCADIAMYKSKSSGGGNYCFYSGSIHAEISRRTDLEQGLKQAAEAHAFEIVYQPIVRTKDEGTARIEALLRWNHPRHGVIEADEFVPLLENLGLIEEVGDWLLTQALRQLKQWQTVSNRPDLALAVNCPPRQFTNRGAPERIRQALATAAVAASCLDLELSESTLITLAQNDAELLAELAALGVNIVVDYYGTGQSSLQQLRLLPVRALKLARSLIRNVPDDANANTIVRAALAMAGAMGLTVTAEGVETLGQLQFLRGNGCELVQGLYFQAPADAPVLTTFLSGPARSATGATQ